MVAIPTVDRDEYLRVAIASVLGQTHRNLECIVVDDGVTGVGRKVVETFDDPRVRYHRNDRRLSMAANWNQCVQLAKGAHLLILHDDDLLAPDFLARAVQIFYDNPEVTMVGGSVNIIDVEGRWLELHRVTPQDAVFDGPRIFQRLVRENFLRCPGVILRSGTYGRTGGFDEIGFATDWGMWLRACLVGKVALLADPIASYRVGYGSSTDRLRTVAGALERIQSEEKAVRRAADAARAARIPEAQRAARNSLSLIRLRRGVALAANGQPFMGMCVAAAAWLRDPGLLFRCEPRNIGYYAKMLLKQRREERRARAAACV